MTRYTFVVQVHPDGISTIENLLTRERVQVPELATVGTQIVGWLEALAPPEPEAAEGDDE